MNVWNCSCSTIVKNIRTACSEVFVKLFYLPACGNYTIYALFFQHVFRLVCHLYLYWHLVIEHVWRHRETWLKPATNSRTEIFNAFVVLPPLCTWWPLSPVLVWSLQQHFTGSTKYTVRVIFSIKLLLSPKVLFSLLSSQGPPVIVRQSTVFSSAMYRRGTPSGRCTSAKNHG